MNYYSFVYFFVAIFSLTGCQSGSIIPGMGTKSLVVGENPWHAQAKLRALHCGSFWNHPDMALQYMNRAYSPKSETYREHSALSSIGEEEKAEALVVDKLTSLRQTILSHRGDDFDTFKSPYNFTLGDYNVEEQYFPLRSSGSFLLAQKYIYTTYNKHSLGNIYDPSVAALAPSGKGRRKLSTTSFGNYSPGKRKLPQEWTVLSYYENPSRIQFEDVKWVLDFIHLRLYIDKQDAYELIKQNSQGYLSAVVSYTIDGCSVHPDNQYGHNTILTGGVTAIELHYPRSFGVQKFGKAIATWQK